MINTLYLPELREMLAQQAHDELREFCMALHPARVTEFMEGLTAGEAWQVIQAADLPLRAELFIYFDPERQVAIIESEERQQVSTLIAELAPDDRVDLLQDVAPEIVEQILPLLPQDERRDIQRLLAYPEGTAGAVMTTDVLKLPEELSVKQALEELGRQAEQLETWYYFYIVDDSDHLRGVVSARQLVSALTKPDTLLGDIMETDVVAVNSLDDQEEVAHVVARFNLLAIPVVDHQRQIVGIITHDDVIDVVREEATEDAHRIAAVDPLEESYLKTALLTLSWKRGIWLTILFFAALLTAYALKYYHGPLESHAWLVLFIPLVISSGGNSGSQSATLVITALATGDVKLTDWGRVVRRELAMGLLLGGFLGLIGYAAGYLAAPEPKWIQALTIPVTLVCVTVCGTLCGSVLPLLFRRLGLDPALMSNPFVAGLVDILGIVIYMNVAMLIQFFVASGGT